MWPQARHSGVPRPTLHDVAREAGVSARTVSRVLNEEPRISAETRQRVLAVVRRLGFRPNAMARNMRVGARDAAVGLVIPDLGNPFFGTVASGVEKALRTRGLHLVIASSEEDPDREHAVITTLLDRQVAGLIIVPAAGGDYGYLRNERRHGLPLVFLDRPAVKLAVDTVVSANFEGAVAAVEHLVGYGHRRIGFVGDLPTTLYTRRERFRGYRCALEAAGIPLDRALIEQGHHESDAAQATARLLATRRPPTAIFAANNLACMGVLMALVRAHRRDVALVGFDDFSFADLLEPATTVVAQDAELLGVRAAELILSRLDGDRTRARTLTLDTRLIVRGSGELRPDTPAPAMLSSA
ncbi:MAG: LacI family transcriptional regulator [Actinobacteria bacterium 13_1_20CM_3_71_11]|nr:MAG: LacI family transcriptional regulator [Actinobacteria bacterium 13_1_20CM_3_71_11]TML24963.1 MAG: LacI family transcriptional regulator [Actinomycetota bacterium]